MKKHKQRVIFLFFLMGVIWLSCHKSEKSPQIVARVGSAVLTREVVESEIPEAQSGLITQDQKRSYVRRWIDTEVLYQEAHRRGLGRSPEIQHELEKLQKVLLVNKLLEQALVSDTQIPEQEIVSYYEQNKDGFIRNDAEVRFEFFILDSREEALAIKNEIRKGRSFEEIAASRFPSLVKKHSWDSGYLSYAEIESGLRKVIRRLSIGQLYGPYKTDLGFYIVRLVDRQSRESVRSLEEVRRQIELQMEEKKRRELYHQFLLSLKEKRKTWMDLSVLEKTPVDSTVVKEKE